MKRLLLALALCATFISSSGVGSAMASEPIIGHAITCHRKPSGTVVCTTRVKIPLCTEDEPYLLGRGDFDGTAWSRYVCVHIDAIG